jgi:oligoendopeptidase F
LRKDDERKVMFMSNIVDHITTLVKKMSRTELQNTVLRLAEQNEHVRTALHQVWKEEEREIRLQKSVEWTPADWFEARKHFEPIIQDELTTPDYSTKPCTACSRSLLPL